MDQSVHLMQGFHRLTREQRVSRIKEYCDLTQDEADLLIGHRQVDPLIAENWIENLVGFFPIPMGVATYFRIDGKDRFIPMAVEETSIIAAASASAKWVRKSGSVQTFSRGRMIIGQIQIPRVKDQEKLRDLVHDNREFLIELANEFVPGLVRRGGGVRDISVRFLDRPDHLTDQMAVIHIHCDPCDAMGANLINQVCEGLKPTLEELTKEKIGLCILSNLVDENLSGAEVVLRNVPPSEAEGIVEASLFAEADPYRATTHNKGVLNGIDPILIATGNDWRAVEAGIHAYASRSGGYKPITHWKLRDGDLVGRIEVPLAVGTVGGMTRTHPMAKLALKIMGVSEASELARICAAVGLIQNLGALRALSSEGIVSGHMKLHAGNLAIAAGAEKEEIFEVRTRLAGILDQEKNISLTRAKEVLVSVRKSKSSENNSNRIE